MTPILLFISIGLPIFLQKDQDPCSENPCNHGGECSYQDGFISCDCTDGFDGEYCEFEINPCLVDPCQNGGVCEIVEEAIFCKCGENFSGEFCETTICDLQPCGHGGSCFMEQNGSYTCNCPNGYSGHHCEITPCNDNQCEHGTCSVFGDKYICNCDSDYTGDYCEYENPCLPEPCLNDAICIENGPDYTCDCTEPYLYGKNCESDNPCFEHECPDSNRPMCFLDRYEEPMCVTVNITFSNVNRVQRKIFTAIAFIG